MGVKTKKINKELVINKIIFINLMEPIIRF